jgi:hypothetical protein
MNEPVSIDRKKPGRTQTQNSFYFAFLTWCIRHGLQSMGHFSIDGLHGSIKEWIKEAHKLDFKQDFSTAQLNRSDFAQFINYVNLEFMNELCGIDTSCFWSDYDKFSEWKEYHPDGSFRQWMECGK